jgi:hypothetical protein
MQTFQPSERTRSKVAVDRPATPYRECSNQAQRTGRYPGSPTVAPGPCSERLPGHASLGRLVRCRCRVRPVTPAKPEAIACSGTSRPSGRVAVDWSSGPPT